MMVIYENGPGPWGVRQGKVGRGADPMGELVVCKDEQAHACMGCGSNNDLAKSGMGIAIRLEVPVLRQGEVGRGADLMGELVVCEDEHAHACMGCAPCVHARVRKVHGSVDKWRLGCRQRVCYPAIRLVVGLGLALAAPLYLVHQWI
nr:hypothetical protein Iba_chr13eCG9050 [Ipomoea batatas]